MKPSGRALLAIALLLASAAGSAEAQPVQFEERNLRMVVGQQTVLPAEGVEKYSEGVQGVVDVRLPDDASEFVLVGLAPGTTTLLFIMRDGRRIQYFIQVRPSDPNAGVDEKDNIRLDFYFVQVSDKGSHQAGVDWPGTVGGANIGGRANLLNGASSVTASIAAQVLPRLDLAQTSGWAEIKRQATLIVANGEQGHFNSGGEVNVQVKSGFAAGLEQIKFGSQIQVVPRYDALTGRIEVFINANVSDLTSSGGTGLPGRTTSSLNTVVNLRLGQQIVLAGLTSQTRSKDRRGIPILSDLPLIGGLFGTDGGRREETENLVFIVPTVVEAVPLQERDLVERALSLYEESSRDSKERNDVLATPSFARRGR